MKKYLKLGSKNIIVKCILGIIILSLIFSTMNIYIHQDFEKYIATVNGEKISLKLFQNMYLIEREKQKKILGKNFFKLSNNKKFIQETHNYVLTQLINNILLEQYAKKMRLHANETQIKEVILNSAIFQENNKFSKDKYFNYLASINMNNYEYMEIIKKKINTQNLINSIIQTNFILENEKKDIIELLSQERKVKKAILRFSPIINQQNITDKESKNYFERNKNDFYIPEKFKISFIKFTLENFKTNCNMKEINQWYKKNIKNYSTQEKRKYSVIQTKNKYNAALILSELNKNPENFSIIAQKKSTDPISSKEGGSIGWLSIDEIPKEIKNANLNKKNSLSNIIPFKNEFLIVKLDDILIGKTKTINEVYETIKKEIKNQKSLDLYYKLQKKIYQNIHKDPKKLEKILIDNHIFFKNTDWFDKNSIPNKLNIPIIKKAIFSQKAIKKYIQKKDNHSKFFILKNNQSFLIKITNFKNRKKPNFESIKQNIVKKLKIMKAIQETKKKSEKIISELKKGKTNLFQKLKLSFGETETISRYDDRPITSVVFSLPHPKEGQTIYTAYQDENKNFVIISLHKVFHRAFSQKEKNIIVEYLEKNNTEIIFNNLLRNLYEQSIIKYEEMQKV